MAELPTGIVTFLLTDIVGSTRLWENRPKEMRFALEVHDDLVRNAITQKSGHVFKTVGDAFLAAFHSPLDAIEAAIIAQKSLQHAVWGEEISLRVRMSIHTGQVDLRGGDYYGVVLSRAARMLSAANAGQILISSAVIDETGLQLPEKASLKDLGLHRLKDLQRSDRIFQLIHPALPYDFPPLRSLESFAHNLPVQLTTFIGRVREISELTALFGKYSDNNAVTSASASSQIQRNRLVTVTGTAGSGKTRLAQVAAADLIDSFDDGIWLVELAPIPDASSIVSRLAKTLGVEDNPLSTIMDTLIEHLRHRSLLIILDNCEHLIDSCAQLTESLLSQCPYLQILATSREILGIPSERVYRLDSFSIPDIEDIQNLDQLGQFESVQFFVERSAAAGNGFTLTAKNSGVVAQICRQLDGIPLALELAAARTRALSVHQIAERLSDRFRLLTGGSRAALPRHQTLGAALDWSFDLLTSREKSLFAKLSVFSGGWTLAAFEVICSANQDSIDDLDIRDVPNLLMNLVDKSIVVVQEMDGGERYHLLETLRAYALQRLQEYDSGDDLNRQHYNWYCALAEDAEPHCYTADSSFWFDLLERDIDNIYSALSWSISSGNIELGIRLAGFLWRFWYLRGRHEEGRSWLRRLLHQTDKNDWNASTATAFYGSAQLARIQNDYEEAREHLGLCLNIRSNLNDILATAETLNGLGLLARDEGNFHFAKENYQQSLFLYEQRGELTRVAALLGNLGGIAILQEDFASAQQLLERSLKIYREKGDHWSISVTLHNLGIVSYYQKDFRTARMHYREALSQAWESGDRTGLATTLICLGMIAAGQNENRRAACLFGAAESVREAFEIPMPDSERIDYERDVTQVKEMMTDEQFIKTWQEGKALSPGSAVAYALESRDISPESEAFYASSEIST